MKFSLTPRRENSMTNTEKKGSEKADHRHRGSETSLTSSAWEEAAESSRVDPRR